MEGRWETKNKTWGGHVKMEGRWETKNTKGPRQRAEARREAWNRFSLRASRRNPFLLTP